MPTSTKTSRPFKSSSQTSFLFPKYIFGLMAVLLLVCSAACAKSVPNEENLAATWKPKPVLEGVTADGLLLNDGLAEKVLLTAYSQLGTPYRYGGTSPNKGFDCSGFTRWVYSQNGIQLPRSSKEQFQVGRPVDVAELKPGDLLMYKRGSRGSGTHIGIYVGDGKYIHSPSKGKTVMEAAAFDGRGNLKFMGARRVFEDPSSCPLTPQQKEEAKKSYSVTSDVDIKVVFKPGEKPKLSADLKQLQQPAQPKVNGKPETQTKKYNSGSSKKKS